jgi:hypothetical protein
VDHTKFRGLRALLVSKILGKGWRSKILTVNLPALLARWAVRRQCPKFLRRNAWSAKNCNRARRLSPGKSACDNAAGRRGIISLRCFNQETCSARLKRPSVHCSFTCFYNLPGNVMMDRQVLSSGWVPLARRTRYRHANLRSGPAFDSNRNRRCAAPVR